MITRLSKIARLPAVIREQLNRRLHNGELGKTLLPWLNNLPETKKILAELFQGKAITHQNLSEWRRAGYQDWFQLQERFQWFTRVSEQETELNKNDCGDAFETVGWHFLFEIGQGLAELQKIKNPDRRLTRLQTLTRDFTRLQNAYNWSRRVHLEWDKWNNPVNQEPDQPVEVIDQEHQDEYYQDEAEDNIVEAKIEEPVGNKEIDGASGTGVPPVSPCSHGRDARATITVQEQEPSDAPENETESSAPTLGAPACPSEPWRSRASRRPDPAALTKCQTIPALAPTTPPSSTLNIQHSAPQPPRPHLSPVPTRGRRFVCIEG